MNPYIQMVKPTIQESISMFDNEDVVEKSYEALLSIMHTTESYNKKSNQIYIHNIGGLNFRKKLNNKERCRDMFHFNTLNDGIYIPAVKRNYISGSFDIKNDDLIKSGSVIILPDESDFFEWVTVTKINNISKKDLIISFPINKAIVHYNVSHVMVPIKEYLLSRLKATLIISSFMSIDENGNIYHSIPRSVLNDSPEYRMRTINSCIIDCERFGCGAVGLLNDRKYLWLVETKEKITNKTYAKVQFGCDQEIIKSLFYSRSTPITSSGRLRPILHWVRAHKRRLKSGIDIDITKFLRGIEEFEMGNLHFQITQPTKNTSTTKKEAVQCP